MYEIVICDDTEADLLKLKMAVESSSHYDLATMNIHTFNSGLSYLEDFKAKGIENILALRGDINPDVPPKDDFKYASDLISYIKQILTNFFYFVNFFINRFEVKSLNIF